MDKLTYIKLESVSLTDWELLHGTTGATTISILGSNVKSINFLYRVNAPYLVYLSLSGNIIEELNFAIFKFIPNVQYLNLSFNRIVTITKSQLAETYNLKSLDLRGNGIQLISDFIYLINKSTDYLNIIENFNPTEKQFADYLDNLINEELVHIDLINHFVLPQVINQYDYTCPTMFSKDNEFKYLKINRSTSNTELLAKHIFPCIEYIEIIDNGAVDHVFILKIARYYVKRLNLYNSNLRKIKPYICQLYKLRELSLINASGIDNVIKRMSCCKSLSKLDLTFNRITEFSKLYDILLNTKLQILNLSFNNIEYLKDVNDNTSIILSKSILEVLDLSKNKLTMLTIQWVLTPSLRVLNCSYNQIRFVYFDGFLFYGNARLLSTLNLANNQDLTFEQNIFDSLTGLTEIDLSETNISSDNQPETVANLCKIYLNRNSLWEYVRFTCKYNPEYEIYLSGNDIQNVRSVRMFYATSVLDISHNLLEDLLGIDCNDISQTKILNVSSNMIDIIDKSFLELMKYLEELDLSNNPLMKIQRFDMGVNTQLRKLILANSELHEIDIITTLAWNVYLIQVHITSLCAITTKNCPYSGEQLKRDAFEGSFKKTNDFVNFSQGNCAKLQITIDVWSCEDDKQIFLNLECVENIEKIN
ncbi:hypothetical protein GJ496_000052 [Pomphorhynchus laevis]|nr:hypothetical protein GJ496_000052 [Pomphorhynchus laevis]